MLVVSIVSTQWNSVQFSCSVMSDSLWPHGLQHARPPCASPTPRIYSNSVHWVSDAFQPSHPLSSPSPPSFDLSQHQGLFKWVSSLHQVAKVLEFHPNSNEDTMKTFFFSHDEDIFFDYFQYCIFKCISEEFSIKSNNWLFRNESIIRKEK